MNWKNLAVYILLTLLLAVLLFPTYVMFITSLKPFEEVFTWPPLLILEDIQWENYLSVWYGNYNFSRSFFNSIVVAGSTAVLCILLASPAAYALSRYRFFGRTTTLFAVLAVQMFSPVILIIPLYKTMLNLGLLDTYIAMIIGDTAFALPMSIWLLTGYFENIPKELEEAAWIDGCSRAGGLVRVVLPIAAPGIVTAGIYAFILAWNDLIFALTFVTEESMRPITLALTDFVGWNVVYWHEMMAASVISVLPVALLFSFVQKYLVRGLTAGAVKA